MAELVGESLHVVWFEGVGVTDDVEVGRCDRALTHTLAHQEEIIPAQITGRGERGEEERGRRREGGGGEGERGGRGREGEGGEGEEGERGEGERG